MTNMSYTPESQQLEPGIQKMLEGIELLRGAAHERIGALEDYTPCHIDNMVTLCDDLTRLEAKLRKL